MADRGAIGATSPSARTGLVIADLPERPITTTANADRQPATPQAYPDATTTTTNPPGGFQTVAANGPYVTVSGTVKQNGAAVTRIVRAYRRRDGYMLGESTSDPATGAFSIDCLGFVGPVYVLALDDTDTAPDFNAEIFDLITPA